ncbi:hypothetical protein LTS08_008147 [Lithohypha guttulata]|nr:hypothetical protein LTS08_008147 [Lithohypha guttulata]
MAEQLLPPPPQYEGDQWCKKSTREVTDRVLLERGYEAPGPEILGYQIEESWALFEHAEPLPDNDEVIAKFSELRLLEKQKQKQRVAQNQQQKEVAELARPAISPEEPQADATMDIGGKMIDWVPDVDEDIVFVQALRFSESMEDRHDRPDPVRGDKLEVDWVGATGYKKVDGKAHPYVLVKWQGYSAQSPDTTWEPLNNFLSFLERPLPDVLQLIEEFAESKDLEVDFVDGEEENEEQEQEENEEQEQEENEEQEQEEGDVEDEEAAVAEDNLAEESDDEDIVTFGRFSESNARSKGNRPDSPKKRRI